MSSSGVQLKLTAGYQRGCLLEQPRAVVAVASAGDDQGPGPDGVLAGGEVEAVLGVDGRDQVGRRYRPGGRSAALLGVAVGAIYAATAALFKSLTDIALQGPLPLLTSWQLYTVIVVGAGGLLLNQLAFQAGPLAASLPAIATVDPLLSIVIGVVVYDERIRHDVASGFGLGALLLVLGIAVIQLTRRVAS